LNCKFLYPAEIELDEAIKYYNHQLPGLGYRFYQEISCAIERIKIMPEAWTKVGNRTRRCLLKGFPYSLLYVFDEKEILVTALAHHHRNPKQFKDRLI
jgi:hypothetical protein